MPRANDTVASALSEMSELLSIAGGDAFRIRAYERAARTVAGEPRDVSELSERELKGIPGVGSHIAAKVRELCDTGHLAELEDLRSEVPAGLRSLLEVPGLGPKRARQIYDELHIASLPELLDALHDHRLRALHGWGAASEDRLRQAIAQSTRDGQRMQLGVALDIAEDLVDGLATLDAVEQVTYAGSLRRMRETIGDVDLLVASGEPDAVMAGFGDLELIDEVVDRGTTKAVARTTKGVHVDLRVVSPSVWGAALLYFTGSKAHSIHLRKIAQRLHCKLSEYGLERDADGSIVAASTEEEVYAALGMDWVPPTLREDRGEVEAALEGALPRLVEVRDIKGDLHAHTVLTDGLATMEEMMEAAERHRYRYLAITDHAPLLRMQRMTTEKALEQREQLRALEARDGIALLHGSELNIQADGSLDWDDEFLDGFDVLVASVHSHFTMEREAMTARLVRAIEHPAVNIIGHPTARSIGRRPPIDFDPVAVFEAAARAGTALEINCVPERLDLDDELARLALDHGVLFAIDTDAHATGHLDNIRYGVATAQRGWVPPERVVNTFALPELKRFLAKGRRR